MGSSCNKVKNPIEQTIIESILELKASYVSIKEIKSSLEKCGDGYNEVTTSNFIKRVVPLLHFIKRSVTDSSLTLDCSKTDISMLNNSQDQAQKIQSQDQTILSFQKSFVELVIQELLSSNAEENRISYIITFLIPVLNKNADADFKSKIMTENLLNSLGNHKTLFKFTSLIRQLLFFYSRLYALKLIQDCQEKDTKFLLQTFTFDSLSIHEFDKHYKNLINPLLGKYEGNLSMIEVNDEIVFDFIKSNKLFCFQGIFTCIKKEQAQSTQ